MASRRSVSVAASHGEAARHLREGERLGENGGAALEVAGVGDAEDARGQRPVLLAEHVAQLLPASTRSTSPRRPGSRRPATTRIRRREAGARAARGRACPRRRAASVVAGDLVRVEVHAGQLGVVVQHLLEVRDRPGGVDGVAVEAAADLVVDAAAVHVVEREQRGVEQAAVAGGDVAAQQEVERRRVRELRGRRRSRRDACRSARPAGSPRRRGQRPTATPGGSTGGSRARRSCAAASVTSPRRSRYTVAAALST